MYTIVNNIENKIIANLSSNDAELINKVNEIRIENEDFDFSILGISDAKEYIEEYCSNLDLLDDYEVKKFLDTYGIEVEENESESYIDLMMDNHKCTEWKGVQYYLSDSLDLSDDEEKIYDVLAYALHV
jgi:hypothetical protein